MEALVCSKLLQEAHCGTGGSTQSSVERKKADDGATRAVV